MTENENPTPVQTEERPLSPSEAHEAAQLTNFFDAAPSTPNLDTEEGQEPASPETIAEWYFSDNIKGDGPKPAWLKDKYKSVADQASAYSELEKKLGEFKGAPKDGYKLDDIPDLDEADPLLNKFLPKFKELNMSQDAVKSLINEFSDYRKSLSTVDVHAEMKKLGPEAHDMIKKTNQWMENNLDPKVVETIKTWIHTSEDMQALNALRAFQPLSRSPTTNDMQQSITFETLKEIKNEKFDNWQKYQDDPNYRAALDDRMSRAVVRQEAQKKR